MRLADIKKWQNLTDRLQVTYPHPKTKVNIQVYTAQDVLNYIEIVFKINDLPDLANVCQGRGQRKFINEFELRQRIDTWPGVDRAAKYLTAIWAFFLFHEGLEGVRWKKPRSLAVCDPHGNDSDEPDLHVRVRDKMEDIDFMIGWLENEH